MLLDRTVQFMIICIMALGALSQDELTQTEQELVKQLRLRVDDALTKDLQRQSKYLVRWIRARNHDLVAAEEMLRRSLAWRVANRMDGILHENFSMWQRRAPFYFTTFDYNGRPSMAAGLGQIDIRRAVVAGEQRTLDRYILFAIEQALNHFDRVGNATGSPWPFVDGYMLFSLSGYSTRAHACVACLSTWLMLIQNYERNYPQLVRNIIVINTPRIFQTVLSVVRPFFSPHTAKGIHLYGLNKAEWKPELLKLFPEDLLLPQFGGTLMLGNDTLHNKPKITIKAQN